MKRARVLFMVAAVTVVTLLTTLPAMATPASSDVYVPLGDGITYSCTGGPPFVFGPNSPEGNCAVQQIGSPPAGLVCDVPTTVTDVHGTHQETFDGMLCR